MFLRKNNPTPGESQPENIEFKDMCAFGTHIDGTKTSAQMVKTHANLDFLIDKYPDS